ncbi:hypothetical protein F3J19_15935 [Burkholderia sp. Ax-1724]|nr:hypothetical protein [Burkholderia sp. Ax-1724]NIF81766.1 hypothetical protein [Paraburkholderia sp. Cy-641]
MNRLVMSPDQCITVRACASKRACDTYVDKLLKNRPKRCRADEHALSALPFLPQHNISKSLRCYKRETLCKPMFYKTVLE